MFFPGGFFKYTSILEVNQRQSLRDMGVFSGFMRLAGLICSALLFLCGGEWGGEMECYRWKGRKGSGCACCVLWVELRVYGGGDWGEVIWVVG